MASTLLALLILFLAGTSIADSNMALPLHRQTDGPLIYNKQLPMKNEVHSSL